METPLSKAYPSRFPWLSPELSTSRISSRDPVTELCLHVGVDAPIRHGYDYLPPARGPMPPPGARVRVPFGPRKQVGVVLELRPRPSGGPELKRVSGVLDEIPVIDSDVLRLLIWAARYYQHPIGQVVHAALPRRMRRGEEAELSGTTIWRLTAAGREEDPDAHRRAPVRRTLLQAFQNHKEGLDLRQLRDLCRDPSAPLKALVGQGLVEADFRLPPLPVPVVPEDVTHNSHQREVVEELRERLDSFRCTLLHGVTGSGKTEVYRAVIRSVLDRGGQVLVIVPEIGLAPQLRDRLARDARTRIAVYHSERTEREQYLTWLLARSGKADIVVGARSAVFLPFRDLRLIVVDEEHDPSFKQQEGFRYHARDVAVYRAHHAGIPIILGTATPSIETWRNVRAKKYRRLRLPTRAGASILPNTELIDLNRYLAEDGLSEPLLAALRETLDHGDQALLFLNRRGFAPVLYSPRTKEPMACPDCQVSLTYHQPRQLLVCHYCGFRQSAERELEGGAVPLGAGTQRIEERLRAEFPDCPVLRLDRDRIRGRGELERSIEKTRRGDYRIVVGTQMLCKGHDFPEVTLVGVINIDSQLFSPRLRAPERMAQMLVQVSGRAGRRVKPGRVLLQTCLPKHPVLRQLLSESYESWLERLSDRRRELGLPPYSHWAVLRAQHKDYRQAETFLLDARNRMSEAEGVSARGPAPAMMPKLAGVWRAQLLLQAVSRKALERCLDNWLQGLGKKGRVSWTLDVDPLDIA